ncbi:MAG: hypothetical protein ACO1SV_03900 [Fimbriimonas sp.]
MESNCKPLAEVLEELERVAGDAPFLALGQTVFWDEPMKAGVALAARRLGKPRRLVAGVHDTDYFAKLPSGPRRPGQFRALPHNDTTTRGLWSAAGEFSALFGSETVITRDMLVQGGLRVDRLMQARPGFLDQATEAWHWRGIVSLDEHAPITADVPLKQLMPELRATLDWALDHSIAIVGGQGREIAEHLADELRAAFCEHGEEPGQTVSDFYERLLPTLYEFCANARVPLETTRTSHLLRFNTSTCDLPRFELANLFVGEATRDAARRAYDTAIRDAHGLYELARFGTGAIPFDLVVPGLGRGTIRIGNRGVVINTPKPQFISLKRPLGSLRELAELVEAKLGTECVLVGKAVALIGMLAREFVFVFHEGASGYVRHSRRMHQLLAEAGHPLRLSPILRVRYDAWSALQVCCSWMRLPELLQRPFGTEEVCAPSLAARWRDVGREQERLLARLGELRRPVELIGFLDETSGGAWRSLASEYAALHARLADLERDLDEVRERRRRLYEEIRSLKRARVEAEEAKGRHWRDRHFEREPGPEDEAERTRLTEAVDAAIRARSAAEARVHELRREQNELVNDPQVRRIHERRRSIELEAELKRLRLIRSATVASRGLEKANLRPSAWWFRLVCPDGLWFRETVDSAEYYLEPLV